MTVKGWAEHDSKNNNNNKKQKKTKHTEKLKERIEQDAIGPVAEPDLQIKGGGGRLPNPEIRGEGADLKKKHLVALVSSKNKGHRALLLDPPLRTYGFLSARPVELKAFKRPG